MRYYYEVYDRADESFSPSQATITELKGHRCAKCGEWPATSDALPDVVIEDEAPASAVSYVSRLLFGIIAKDFAEALGFELIERHLRLGRLLRPNGSLIPNYRSFLGREPLLLRGGPKSQHFLCTGCGALKYIPVPANNPYVTAASVSPAQPVFAGATPRIIVNEALRRSLGSKWNKLTKIYRLPVREHAEDGLADHFSLFPTQGQLTDYNPNPPPFLTDLS